MLINNLPDIGERLYLMHKEILVINIYSTLHLLKVRYIGDPAEFFIDICAAASFPDIADSISLELLKGREYR